ncbi:MAG: sugar phosphate nucleotidyltransferase [Actinomycetaceae bacterium]|nr:sugar phosphate nucleotidyltransferase [Actinomycetaceae bacterium]
MTADKQQLHVIIPAGGAGKRLWPLSRASYPKFLLPLSSSGHSLLGDTIIRLAPIASSYCIVTGRKHHNSVRKDIESSFAGKTLYGAGGAQCEVVVDEQKEDLGTDISIIVEPEPKNSLAAIGLATLVCHQRYGPTIVGSFAADHVIGSPKRFIHCIETAIRCAKNGKMVTLGVTPHYASTSYGYIERKVSQAPLSLDSTKPLDKCMKEHDVQSFGPIAQQRKQYQENEDVTVPQWCEVVRFHEKPDAHTAVEYVGTGRFYWNAGIFVFSTKRFIEFMRRHQPAMLLRLQRIAESYDTSECERVMAEEWPQLPHLSIDHGLAQPLASEGEMAVIPTGDIQWNDVGTYQTVAELNGIDSDGNALVSIGTANAQTHMKVVDTKNTIVLQNAASPHQLALAGVNNLIVVDTGQTVLITTSEYADKIPQVIERLEEPYNSG